MLVDCPTRWPKYHPLEPLTTHATGRQAWGPGEQPHGAGGQVLSDTIQLQPLLGHTQMLLSPIPREKDTAVRVGDWGRGAISGGSRSREGPYLVQVPLLLPESLLLLLHQL